MNNTTTKELKNFTDACKEFKESKLILIEKNISLILNTIAKGTTLYNIVADKIIGYNFKLDYEKFLNTKSFDFIEADKNIIPFIFSLLNEMDNGKINIFTFLKQVFGSDSTTGYKMFSTEIIQRFEDEIINVVKKISDINLEQEIEKNSEIKNEFPMFDGVFVSRLGFVNEAIMNKISEESDKKFRQKNDAITICFSISVCLERKEYSAVLGLLLGLKNILISYKRYKIDLNELLTLINAIINY